MTEPSTHEIRLSGWTIARVDGALSPEAAAALGQHLLGEIATGARIAVDLRRVDVAAASAAAALIEVQRHAHNVDAVVVVVTADSQLRDALTRAGVVDVHESLDAALHDDAGVLRRAGSLPPPPLTAAGSVALEVSAEDIAGGSRP
jgi:ABC-type transporter Mla MlaB component